MRSIEVPMSRRAATGAALCAAGALSLALPGAGVAAAFTGASAPKQTDSVSSSGVAPVIVACPTGTSKGCSGTLTLKTSKPVKVGKSHKIVTIGRVNFAQIKPGKRATLRVTLTSEGKKLVKASSVDSNAVVSSRDGAGHKASKTTKITLKKKSGGSGLPPSSGSY